MPVVVPPCSIPPAPPWAPMKEPPSPNKGKASLSPRFMEKPNGWGGLPAHVQEANCCHLGSWRGLMDGEERLYMLSTWCIHEDIAHVQLRYI
eukprot:967483-Pelagomonas_calceolata.AAC.2